MTEKKKEDSSAKNDLIFLLTKISILAILLAVTFLFVFGICRCSGDMMSPAFKDGDLAVYCRLQKNYHPRDVVVIEKMAKPEYAGLSLCREIKWILQKRG